jgi:hypothetical protein
MSHFSEPTSILIVCGFALICLCYFVLWPLRAKPSDFIPTPIMTSPEIVFYRKIVRAVPELAVFPQVSMSGIMQPSHSKRDGEFFKLFNKIAQKRIDYVICDPRQEFAVVCLIELDDSSHNPKKDALRDSLTNDAGYRTIRFPNAKKPSMVEIARLIRGR